MPPIAVALAAAAASAAVDAALTAALGAVLAGVIGALAGGLVSMIGAALLRKDPSSPDPIPRTFTIKSPISSHKLIVGQPHIGGTITFLDTSADNQTLFMVITFGARPAKSIDGIYFNDTYVPVDQFGAAIAPTANPDGSGSPPSFAGAAKTTWADGTVAGAVEFLAVLSANSAKWTPNMLQKGRPALLLRLFWGNVYAPVGIPNVTAIIRGRKIFDPRVTPTTLASITTGSPGLFGTTSPHGLLAGDHAWFQNTSGTTPAIDQEYEIGTVPTNSTFTLLDAQLNPLSITADATGVGGQFTKMEWTDNSALVIQDWLCDPVYGLAQKFTAEVPVAVLEAAANVCDTIIPRSATAAAFTADHTTDLITYSDTDTNGNDFSLPNFTPVLLTSTGSLPTGLTSSPYYVAAFGALSVYLYDTVADAKVGGGVGRATFSDNGTGTLTLTLTASFTADPTVTSSTATAQSTYSVNTSTSVVTLLQALAGPVPIVTGDSLQVSASGYQKTETINENRAGQWTQTVQVKGTAPAPLVLGTTYYWAALTDSSGYICASYADAVASPPIPISITAAGLGIQTITLTEILSPSPDFAASLLLDTINLRLLTGTKVRLKTTGTLPTPLAINTDYFVVLLATIPQNSTIGSRIALADSLADARADNVIAVSTNGTGRHTITLEGEPQFTLNGLIDTANTCQAILEDMLTSMAGYIVPSGYSMGLYAAAYLTPHVTITDSDMRGPITVQTLMSGQQSFNRVRGTYFDIFSAGQPTDAPPWTDATYLTADNGEPIWQDVQLPYTNSPSMAQRLFKITLERIRREITVTLHCKITVFQIGVPDVFEINNTQLGWTGQTFETQSWQLANDKDPNGEPFVGIDIVGRQTDANVFAWFSTDEQFHPAVSNTSLPNPFQPAPPTGLTLSSGSPDLFIRLDGTVFSRVYVEWAAPTDQFVVNNGFIEVQHKLSSAIDWEKHQPIPGDELFTYILDVHDGDEIDVRARSQNSLGVYSDITDPWAATISNYVVGGKTDKPSNVTGFQAQVNGNATIFIWTDITDLDCNGYELRYVDVGSPVNLDTQFDSATLIPDVPKGAGITTVYLPPGNWLVGIKAFDTTGNYSAIAATVTVTVVNQNTIIADVPQENAWPGTLDNFVLHYTGVLTPAGSKTVDQYSAISAPSAPTLSTQAGGELGARTAYVKVTLVSPSGETTASGESSLAIAADFLTQVASPASAGNATGFNVYAAISTGAETLQTSTPIPLGETWTEPTTGFATPLAVAVGAGSKANYSTDHGVTWTESTMPMGGNWNGSATNGFVTVAVGDAGAVATTNNGIAWTLQSGLDATQNYLDIEWSPALSLFLAVGTGGAADTSPDGVTWTSVTLPNTDDHGEVAWSTELGLFVVAPTTAPLLTIALLYSADASNWNTESVAVPSLLTFQVDIDGLAWTGFAFVMTLSGRYSGHFASYLLVSTNATTWTDILIWQSGGVPHDFFAIAGNGAVVVFGGFQVHSPGGPANRFINTTPHLGIAIAFPVSDQLHRPVAAAYDGVAYMIVGGRTGNGTNPTGPGDITRSTDAVTFVDITSPTLQGWLAVAASMIGAAPPPAVNSTGWDVFNVFVPDVVALATYTAPTIDAGVDGTVRVFANLNGVLGFDQCGPFDLQLQIDTWMTGGSDPATYQDWTIGSVDMRYLNARISYAPLEGAVAYVDSFEPIIDSAPLVDKSNGQTTIAPGGTFIPFSVSFHSTPEISGTPYFDGSNVRIFGTSGVTSAGFTAHLFTTAGADSGGVLQSWRAEGA